jgi:hypothetical protein
MAMPLVQAGTCTKIQFSWSLTAEITH